MRGTKSRLRLGHPKFVATRVDEDGAVPVLVKFSPQGVDGGARRTADLLRCEHHALASLRLAGIAAAQTAVIEADGRVFLEVQRFDRRGGGRVGVVSLLALAPHAGCDLDSWTRAADGLLECGAISTASHERIHWLERYGELIGNTDRHAGNLSFGFDEGVVGELTPVYDMLPMGYAVRNGEFRTAALTPPSPTPRLPGGVATGLGRG